ncbi:hypothetical protein, partial [Vibrio cholerae]|uniref:hypothetical protein n=1 Tax=Vibrio cholerae TaxID=666 RepID=UPI001C128578
MKFVVWFSAAGHIELPTRLPRPESSRGIPMLIWLLVGLAAAIALAYRQAAATLWLGAGLVW